MKKIYLLILVISCGFAACKKDAIVSKFDNSYAAWQTFRNKNHNSYSYISYGSSVFGYHSETKFMIKNGVITGREFSAGMYEQNTDSLMVNKSWTENEATLNTHTDGAAESLTLDQVYTKAQTIWLKTDAKTNDIYFDVNA